MSVTAGLGPLRDRIAEHFRPDPPGCLGVAVSGGSDSVALLVLLAEWRDTGGGPALRAATVDHGLRPEAAAEARQVRAICDDLGIAHDTLRWHGWDGRGNLSDRARRARYELLAGWAARRGIERVALGHTADDQAETVLMRLAREAGVDGLSAMPAARRLGTVTFDRPALPLRRAALRDVLRTRGIGWIDDPTNEDPGYDRVRARQALAALAPLGITVDGLAAVAGHMAAVRDTLYHYVEAAAHEMVRFDHGDMVIDRAGFLGLPDEIARRLLQEGLKWISGADYPPRGRATARLIGELRAGTGTTLHGCRITVAPRDLRLTREYRAVEALRPPPDRPWDGRWQMTGPETAGITIAALGPDGAAACKARGAAAALPHASLIASPAVWRAETLVAAPLAGLENGWSARLVRDEKSFFAALTAH